VVLATWSAIWRSMTSTACTLNLQRVERSALRPKMPTRMREVVIHNGRPQAGVRAAIHGPDRSIAVAPRLPSGPFGTSEPAGGTRRTHRTTRPTHRAVPIRDARYEPRTPYLLGMLRERRRPGGTLPPRRTRLWLHARPAHATNAASAARPVLPYRAFLSSSRCRPAELFLTCRGRLSRARLSWNAMVGQGLAN
jgi:hypothetical protein